MTESSTLPHASHSASALAEALAQVVAAGVEVGRRHQFFVWSQGRMQLLLPHKLLVCGSYDRSRKALSFEVFNSIALPEALMAELLDGQSPLMRLLAGLWLSGPGRIGRALSLTLPLSGEPALLELNPHWAGAGITELLVHGVSRPQRPDELESLFLLASPGLPEGTGQRRLALDQLLPHLHRSWLRVQTVEHELGTRPAEPPPAGASALITERERQILSGVRQGLSNQQIGERLNISPYTVKNHVQKILRKLGATNRAQALACAMNQNLLEGLPA
ncbi:MAG: hypothetical protein IV097_13535 [Burkholderiaceae bacterium]|nr:hypothetical protein [Burkholderiaceae bacterium]